MAYPKLPDGSQLTRCPGCGVDMDGRDPKAHLVKHYGAAVTNPDGTNEGYRKSQALLASARTPEN